MKYTQAELDAAALADLLADAACAERDGLPEYAATCRAQAAQYANGGAHEAILKGVQS